MEAPQYHHSLIFCPLSSSTGAYGVKNLVQGYLRGCNEGENNHCSLHSSNLLMDGIETAIVIE